jgi:hypothetical protein
MQKACTVLNQDFSSQTPKPAGNIVQFHPRQKSVRVAVYAGSLLAAAACVTFVLVTRNQVAEPTAVPASAFVVQAGAPMKTSIASATLAKRNPTARPALQTVFTGLVSESPATEATFVTAERNQLDWMNRVQLQRVPAEELLFESPTKLHPNARTFRSRYPLQGQVEMTAFQFQR